MSQLHLGDNTLVMNKVSESIKTSQEIAKLL